MIHTVRRQARERAIQYGQSKHNSQCTGSMIPEHLNKPQPQSSKKKGSTEMASKQNQNETEPLSPEKEPQSTLEIDSKPKEYVHI